MRPRKYIHVPSLNLRLKVRDKPPALTSRKPDYFSPWLRLLPVSFRLSLMRRLFEAHSPCVAICGNLALRMLYITLQLSLLLDWQYRLDAPRVILSERFVVERINMVGVGGCIVEPDTARAFASGSTVAFLQDRSWSPSRPVP